MRIAVTYENGNVFQHFGHTEQFKIYNIEDKKVSSSEVIGTNGNGHEALAVYIKEHGVTDLICGGIGGGAIDALAQANVSVHAGVSGNADEAVAKFLDGTLVWSTSANCNHHHDEDHNCGEHNKSNLSSGNVTFTPIK